MPSAHEIQRFVGCRTCLSVQKVYPELPGDDEAEGDRRLFVSRHAGHRIETFARLGESCLSDRPPWDPMATTYFEVTNGHEVLLLRSTRTAIDEPVVRTLAHGRLRLDHVAIGVESDLIRRALDAWFYPHHLRPTKIHRLVAALEELVRSVDPDALFIVFDSADDPRVSIARMPELIYRTLLARCGDIFDDSELERVRNFLTQNRGDDGLLSLRITRTFTIDPE